MGNLGPGELLIILLIAVVVFGAGKFADIGKGLGQGIRNFKKGIRETDEDDVAAKKKKEEPADKKEGKKDETGNKDEKASAVS